MSVIKDSHNKSNPYLRSSYSNYVLCLLTITYAFNFIDRQLITILQESIKADLGLSDTQLGLLTGFSFAVFYVTAGIPIAHWADRGHRPNILALAVGAWSVMTAVSGLAVNYVQLLLARVGVAVGEAGGSPPAHSMISDIYPPEKRATALGIYSVGVNIGVLFGFLLGGILNEYFGWRIAFVVVGLPGLLLAILIKMSVAEAPRGWSDKQSVSDEPIPMKTSLAYFWHHKAIRYLFLGGSLVALSGYSLLSWIAPFFIRIHGIGTAELGVWLALSVGVFGAIGAFSSGMIADRLSQRSPRWYALVPMFCYALALPLILMTLFLENSLYALIVFLLPGLLISTYLPPVLAILHTLVDARARALVSATLLFSVNIIGLGCGPTLVGIISDWLAPSLGVESLRYALVWVTIASIVGGVILFYIASRHLSTNQDSN